MPNIQKPVLGTHSAKTVKGTVSPITQMQSTTPKQRHQPKALFLNPNSNKYHQNVSEGSAGQQVQSKQLGGVLHPTGQPWAPKNALWRSTNPERIRNGSGRNPEQTQNESGTNPEWIWNSPRMDPELTWNGSGTNPVPALPPSCVPLQKHHLCFYLIASFQGNRVWLQVSPGDEPQGLHTQGYGGTGDAPSVTRGTDNLWAALDHPTLLPPSPLDIPKGGNTLQHWQCLLCEVRKDKIKDI